MRRYWSQLAARIDDMTLRQRAMLFATVSLLVVAAAHVALIEPVLARQKRLIERVNRDQSQLTAVRAQIESLVKELDSTRKDPEQQALRELEAKLAAGEKTLAERKQALVAPTRLPALLKDLLGPGQALRMESLRVVPGTEAEGLSGFYRHGVELTLRGGYFDLLQYLARLESLRGRFLWGRTELQVEKYPDVRLTIQVRTLSTQPTLGL
jgi:MSHA biogenesis protein MshJ